MATWPEARGASGGAWFGRGCRVLGDGLRSFCNLRVPGRWVRFVWSGAIGFVLRILVGGGVRFGSFCIVGWVGGWGGFVWPGAVGFVLTNRGWWRCAVRFVWQLWVLGALPWVRLALGGWVRFHKSWLVAVCGPVRLAIVGAWALGRFVWPGAGWVRFDGSGFPTFSVDVHPFRLPCRT